MKNNLLFKYLLVSVVAVSAINLVQGQSEKSAFAITDSVKDGVKWNYLRSIDLRTGTFSDILIRLLSNDDMLSVLNTTAYNGVAAIAYDKKNKRLYYTPMLIDRLSYVDLKTWKTHIVTTQFAGLIPKETDQSNIFTRMVIVDDDGYALTNDGRHLLRFSTDKKATITDLGSLVDDPGNNEMSIHNACSSFGGDLIADDKGFLYLFTSRNYIFKINIQSKVAKYLGTIRGLPENFTTSGAAVNKDDQIVISSAAAVDNFYEVDIANLTANTLKLNDGWHVSDLAGSNTLKTNRNNNSANQLYVSNARVNDSIRIFPNPVTTGEFTILVAGIKPGKLTVDVIDAKGQLVIRKIIDGVAKTYSNTIVLPGIISKGLFVVRISDHNNAILFNDKIVVQ